MSQPLLLYCTWYPSPNPMKVMLILNELDIPFRPVLVDIMKVHSEPYESITPNGRLPALTDPNRGNITIWESGAIIEYLVENYDKTGKISVSGPSTDNTHSNNANEDFRTRYAAKQLLHFQMSGQGPYFGQANWFTHFHPEKVQSVKDRYMKEIDRVTGVLDAILAKSDAANNQLMTAAGKPYLTGSKVMYCDLAFLPWYWTVKARLDDQVSAGGEAEGGTGLGLMDTLRQKYPHFASWYDRLHERDAVKRCLDIARDPRLLEELGVVNMAGKKVVFDGSYGVED